MNINTLVRTKTIIAVQETNHNGAREAIRCSDRVERKDITYKRKDIAVTVRMKVIIPSHLYEKILRNKITKTQK